MSLTESKLPLTESMGEMTKTLSVQSQIRYLNNGSKRTIGTCYNTWPSHPWRRVQAMLSNFMAGKLLLLLLRYSLCPSWNFMIDKQFLLVSNVNRRERFETITTCWECLFYPHGEIIDLWRFFFILFCLHMCVCVFNERNQTACERAWLFPVLLSYANSNIIIRRADQLRSCHSNGKMSCFLFSVTFITSHFSP